MSCAQYLAELKSYFKDNATFNRMNKTERGNTKCAMSLSNRHTRQGTEVWFLLRWNTLNATQQHDFRCFVGRKLNLEPASLFCVDVRPKSARVVLFYIQPLLQKLADAWFHPRPEHRYRLEDALDVLHDPKPADYPLTNLAWGTG